MTFRFLKTRDNLDGVPRALKVLYKSAEGGGFALVEGLEDYLDMGVEDVTGLKRSLESERELHRQAKRDLAQSKSDLEAAQKGDGDGGGGGKPKPEELATLQAKVDKAEGELGRYKDRLIEVSMNVAADRSILEDHADNPVDLFRPLLLPHMGHEFNEETLEVTTFIRNDDGSRRITGEAGKTHDMPGSEYVTGQLRTRADLKSVFPSRDKGGSGSGSNEGDGDRGDGGKPTRNPFTEKHYDFTAQCVLRKENPDEAARLEAAAVESGD